MEEKSYSTTTNSNHHHMHMLITGVLRLPVRRHGGCLRRHRQARRLAGRSIRPSVCIPTIDPSIHHVAHPTTHHHHQHQAWAEPLQRVRDAVTRQCVEMLYQVNTRTHTYFHSIQFHPIHCNSIHIPTIQYCNAMPPPTFQSHHRDRDRSTARTAPRPRPRGSSSSPSPSSSSPSTPSPSSSPMYVRTHARARRGGADRPPTDGRCAWSQSQAHPPIHLNLIQQQQPPGPPPQPARGRAGPRAAGPHGGRARLGAALPPGWYASKHTCKQACMHAAETRKRSF